jgi:hypothetical protein
MITSKFCPKDSEDLRLSGKKNIQNNMWFCYAGDKEAIAAQKVKSEGLQDEHNEAHQEKALIF